MKLTESRLRSIIREEIADVEPYEDVLAKVYAEDPNGSDEYSISVHRDRTVYVRANGRIRSRFRLGQKESQEIANALL
jgi:hypothetical protein